MGDLISRENVKRFFYSPESGTNDVVEDYISEVGLEGEAVDFNEAITERARQLCHKMIEGFMNILDTEDDAYDVESVIQSIRNKITEIRNTEYASDNLLNASIQTLVVNAVSDIEDIVSLHNSENMSTDIHVSKEDRITWNQLSPKKC